MEIEVTTNQRKLLFVKTDDCSGSDIEVCRRQDDYFQQHLKYPSDKFKGFQNYSSIDLPKDRIYLTIGRLTEMDEQEKVKFLEKSEASNLKEETVLYKDYAIRYNSFKNINDSWNSLLEHYDILLRSSLILTEENKSYYSNVPFNISNEWIVLEVLSEL